MQEVHELYEAILPMLHGFNDESQKGLIHGVTLARNDLDLDRLRVYERIPLAPKLHGVITTLRFADHAIMALRERGITETALILSADLLHSYQNVVRARMKLLDRDFIWCYGNEKLLMFLHERPEAERILLHLMKDRHMSEADQLISSANELMENPLPLASGSL
jgi:hypothetical protein